MLRDPGYTRDLELLRARVDLEMKPDGSLTGYVGGYRPWEAGLQGLGECAWSGDRVADVGAVAGGLLRPATQCRLQSDRTGGEKTHISFALRIDALPAFVDDAGCKQGSGFG